MVERLFFALTLANRRENRNRNLSLAPVAERLTELLGQEVKFVPSPVVVDDTVKAAVADMKDGDVILLENTRYRAEETKEWRSSSAKNLLLFADVFVNDAFGTAHRAHCSNVGVTQVCRYSCSWLSDAERDRFPWKRCRKSGKTFRSYSWRR